MQNDTKQLAEAENFTELLAKSFAGIERKPIEVDGLPKFYSKPLNAEDTLTIGGLGIDQLAGMTPSEIKKTTRKVAKFIVDKSVDNEGRPVFRGYDNQLAHDVLATRCKGEVLLDIIGQMQDIGAEDELGETLGKSESEEPKAESHAV